MIELRRGRGATVVGDVDRAALTDLVDQLVTEAVRLGMSTPNLVSLVKERAR